MDLFYGKRIPCCEMPKGETEKAFVDEKMVDLKKYFGNEILVDAAYFNGGITGAVNGCFVRETVAKMLEKAMEQLPEKYIFKVFDGWRPVSVQQQLYDNYYENVRKQHSLWDEEKLEAETVKFVSKPRYDMQSPAVHSTGGAVDLTLALRENEQQLNMGTEFDDFTAFSYTAAFEESGDEQVKSNRRLLYWTMTEAGFTNLPSEWWHYDYGDYFWSCYTKKSILYCGIQA